MPLKEIKIIPKSGTWNIKYWNTTIWVFGGLLLIQLLYLTLPKHELFSANEHALRLTLVLGPSLFFLVWATQHTIISTLVVGLCCFFYSLNLLVSFTVHLSNGNFYKENKG